MIREQATTLPIGTIVVHEEFLSQLYIFYGYDVDSDMIKVQGMKLPTLHLVDFRQWNPK